MMLCETTLLFRDDSYLKEFDAQVVSLDGNLIYLDKTAFYYQGGGQPFDKGKIAGHDVVSVIKTEQGISHELSGHGLSVGATVHGIIDWKRRYLLMRAHSAAHVLSSVIFKRTGALVTGKQLGLDESHIDFQLETFDKSQLSAFVEDANTLVKNGALVSCYVLPRAQAFAIPDVVRLAGKMPPEVAEIRIVDIKNVDIQACGGTHVKDIKEIGTITITRLENKGKGRKRIYYHI